MNSVLLGLILSACIVFSATTDTSDYSCDEAGYLNYLSAWTVTEKTTSRDASSAEFKQRLEYFIDSCEKIHEWNLRNKYHMEFTFYADWHADEFDVMTVTEQRYTGMKPNIPSTTPVLNNSNWRHLLPLTNPCDDVFDGQDNMLYEAIGRPQNCSVSWAFAITDSIEFAIKKLYLETYDQVVDVALSAQELIDCVAKDHGIQGNSCTAVPLVWGFDYVFENGIAYRQFYPHTNVEADTCTMVEENQKYHIAGYEKPHVYNKLGLFEMLLKGPTAVALGLDPEYFQYYRSDAEEGPFFSTAYWRPSVYGVVVEYKQYAVDGESELAQWPFFAVETRLRACDSFIFRLPILESVSDGNVAGIAGFAFSLKADPSPLGTIPLYLIMNYDADPTTQSFTVYETVIMESRRILYKETGNDGVSQTTNRFYVSPSYHYITLSDSKLPSWPQGVNLTVVFGETQIVLSIESGKSLEGMIHPTKGFIPVSEVTKISECSDIDPIIANSEDVKYLTFNVQKYCDTYSPPTLDISNIDSLVAFGTFNHNFKYVTNFQANGMPNLEYLLFGYGSFGDAKGGTFKVTNCPNLKVMYAESRAFAEYSNFELSNLDGLEIIDFGIDGTGYNIFPKANLNLKGIL